MMPVVCPSFGRVRHVQQVQQRGVVQMLDDAVVLLEPERPEHVHKVLGTALFFGMEVSQKACFAVAQDVVPRFEHLDGNVRPGVVVQCLVYL